MTADIWTVFEAVAASRPAHPALLRGDVSVSFSGLRDAAIHASLTLRRAGLAKGDRCIIWGENAPEMAAAILGVMASGAIAVIVNAEAPQSHFHHAARLSGARLALADAGRLATASFDGRVLALEEAGAIGRVVKALHVPTAVHTGEPASIFFTSGSTGLPKGVTQSHQNLIWGAATVAGYLGLRDDDRILCAIPWAFDYGWGQLLSTFTRGITHILPLARSAAAVCEAIERHAPTILPGVPALFANLIRGVSPLRDTGRGSIRLITNTGSRIPETLFPEIRDLFPGAAISLNYGLTETYRSATLPTALAAKHPDSVGRAIPGVQLAVLREDGGVASPGEEGEIVHRGGGVFLGYWGEPEKTALVRKPDPLWRHAGIAAPFAVFTGDLGWFDDEGLLHIRGRRDRQIKSMGVRVSPDEVEGLIHATGLVEEVAIFARPHEFVGEMIIAAIVPKQPGKETLLALKKSARASMSQFMQPMEWHVLEALPRTPSAKIDYPALKRQFGGTVQA